MKYPVISLHDIVAEVYNPPFVARTVDEARRMFGDMVKDTSSGPGQHPADYILFCVGTWDSHTGVIESATPQKLATGLDFQNVVDMAPLFERSSAVGEK